MTSPLLGLRAAILARCAADAALSTLLGGAGRLYDEPPRGEPALYALFGPAELSDWSTSSDRGHEQQLGIVVWSRPGNAAAALAAADRIATLLDDAPLAVAGHRLVSLAVLAQNADRDPDTGLGRVALRLRATTEVAP